MKINSTRACQELIAELEKKYGELVFHLSSGCCGGHSPTCFKVADYPVSDEDVKGGELCGVPFYMGRTEYERLKERGMTIDVVAGYGSGYSLESPEGKTFIVRAVDCGVE